MEQSANNFELFALNKSETTTTSDSSDVENFNIRRLALRRRRSRTVGTPSPSKSSCNIYGWVSRCCWHFLWLLVVGNLLWVSGLTLVASQLRTDLRSLKLSTERA